MGDLIADVTAERAFETVLDAMERHDVRELTERLGDRERLVIRAHYGLGVPRQTLHQIGNRLGVTAERARQIEVNALDALRDALVGAHDFGVPAPRDLDSLDDQVCQNA